MPDTVKRWALVVEDDDAVRDVIVALLAAEDDLAAVGVPSGARALQVLGAVRFHVLLVDLAMPGMNGLDLIERVRARRETRTMPVVVVTALPPGALPRRVAEAAHPVVGKPLDRGVLLATVRATLGRPSGWGRG
jgi:CheY-like chemotaxis protein